MTESQSRQSTERAAEYSGPLTHMTHIAALQVEVGQVERDAVFGRRDQFPDAALVARVEVRERGRGDGAVRGLDRPPARLWPEKADGKQRKTEK